MRRPVPLTGQQANPWLAAQEQLALIAERQGIAPELRQRLISCERELTVRFPVVFDDGTTHLLTGYRVQHSTARGPAKGGIRYDAALTLDDARLLAMTMTWKCALLGLPFGGGKGGVVCDAPQLSTAEKQRITQRYISEIAPLIGPDRDILAPDLGTNAETMTWVLEAYSAYAGAPTPAVVTGKPGNDGVAAARRVATGYGVAVCVREALVQSGLDPAGRTAIIQGFGNVGATAARTLQQFGLRIVGVSDITGAVYNASGLDLAALDRYVRENGGVAGFPGGEPLHGSELLEQPADVLVPAATGGQIHIGNADRIQVRIVAEGANGPTTPEADAVLRERGILVIPDIICNAGGVFVSYLEWLQDLGRASFAEGEALQRLESSLLRAYRMVAQAAETGDGDPRAAALGLAVTRVARAISEREQRTEVPVRA